MKAVQLVGPKNLVLQELPSRPLGRREIRIGVAATCVCGSDLKNILDPVFVPQTPGHEFSGTVIEVGPGSSQELKEGDRVTAFPMMSCMNCAACARGDYRDCKNKKGLGFQLAGSFAEEVIVDERLAVRLQEGLSYEQGALVEHLCCGYRLAREIEAGGPGKDSHIVIIGDGPIALADLQSLRLLGFTNITVLGKHRSRLELAGSLGARRALTEWQDDLPPVDIAILAASAEPTLSGLIGRMRRGSIVYAQTRIRGAAILETLQRAGVVVQRAFAYYLQDFLEIMSLMKSGKLETERLITKRLRLSEVPAHVADLFDKADNFKVLISSR
jgi:threonine dehydrogenase-like Zn-dependent dehydrogenase